MPSAVAHQLTNQVEVYFFFLENVKMPKDLWSAATQRWHVFVAGP
jgi:hypothetical protein